MSWSHYLLQVNLYLIVFYAFYRLLLANETYFVLNRIYLICAGVFSLGIPFIQLDWLSKREVSQQIYVSIDQINQFIGSATIFNEEKSFHWGNAIVLVYLVGVLLFTARFVARLIGVRKMLKNFTNGLAFSFWNKKVVGANLPEAATVHHHEDIHIKQFHTADVIFFEVLGIITWFNPIIYFYKETIKAIHEYLADKAAAEFQGDKEAYAMLLLSQAFGMNNNTLTNGFFKKSMIKKRIFMLYKERSKKTAILKYGIFVPLFASALLLSSATIRKNEQILAAADEIPLNNVSKVVKETLTAPREIATKIAATASKDTQIQVATSSATTTDDIESFYKFLGNNIKYPSRAADNHLQGNLILSFTVNNKKIEDIDVAPKLGFGADEEAAAVVASYTGDALADGNYSMRIQFRLSGSKGKIFNQNAVPKEGYTALNPLTIMGSITDDPNQSKEYSFVSLQTPPSYPGGIAAFYKFLAANIKYPKEAADKKIQGYVFISFVVEVDGALSNIKIDRKLGYGTDEEAIRVLNLSPKWNPGYNDGAAVRTRYNIPIRFALNGGQKTAPNATGEKVDVQSFFKGIALYDDKTRFVVLDGKPFNGQLKDLKQDDIEAITILKDQAAIALYGDAGKNGAILVITKNGPKAVTVKPKDNK